MPCWIRKGENTRDVVNDHVSSRLSALGFSLRCHDFKGVSEELGVQKRFSFSFVSVLKYFGNGEALIEQISKFHLLIPAGGRHKKGEP